ncbi:Dirigent protein 23 [Abeliophyllum distichum]|uniref:Dirigent protein n=1 Tax=Abeliophyllum distichum TaxID=126358 RepID=A0ABD1P833_9LAMI
MGKFSIVMFMFCSLVIAMAYGNAQEQARFQNLCRGTEKTTTLQIFIQDELGGKNKTVWEVARSSITANSPTLFGQVRVLDDLITAGPSRTSEKIGRAQGLITSADLKEPALGNELELYIYRWALQRKYTMHFGEESI